MARPTQYTPEQFLPEILQWIGEGKTLRSYCLQQGKPSYGTVYDWLEQGEDVISLFAQARVKGQDAIADECIEIADTEEDANRAKVRIWTRLQLLSKWNPKKYGERIAQDLSVSGAIQILSTIPRPAQIEDGKTIDADIDGTISTD